jgi:DNA-binding XRE family transcriptional regulator
MRKSDRKKFLRLKYYREKCGYHQDEFGKFIGVSVGQYSKKENGTQKWDLEECIILRDKINEHLSKAGETAVILDYLFFAEKVSNPTQRKAG